MTEEPEDDVDMEHEFGTVYVRPMVEIMDDDTKIKAARWPIPFTQDDLADWRNCS